MHIKTFIRSCLATLMGAGLQLASSSHAQQPPGYETGFETISRITGDLHQALDRSQRPALYPAAFLLTNLPTPWLQAYPVKGATNATRAVCLSRGYVDLLNFISHAKAIDGVSHGFFIKAMARLALEGGEQLPDLQADSIHNSWSFETMNRQASSFNQMAGALVAIEMAHAYLGHYQKYGSQTDSRGHSVPINRVINQAEWREAVMLGARHALDCGMAVDGIKMAFESVDKMPARPAWRIYFLPDAIEGKEVNRINRELDRMQKNAFVSFAR